MGKTAQHIVGYNNRAFKLWAHRLTVWHSYRVRRKKRIIYTHHDGFQTSTKRQQLAMKFSPFWHPSHAILLCLENCIKTHIILYTNNTTSDFRLYLLTCLPLPPPASLPSLLVTFLVCVRAFVRVGMMLGMQHYDYIYYFLGLMYTFLLSM